MNFVGFHGLYQLLKYNISNNEDSENNIEEIQDIITIIARIEGR